MVIEDNICLISGIFDSESGDPYGLHINVIKSQIIGILNK